MSVLSSHVDMRMVSAMKERDGGCRKRLDSNRGKERKPNIKNKNKQQKKSIICKIYSFYVMFTIDFPWKICSKPMVFNEQNNRQSKEVDI